MHQYQQNYKIYKRNFNKRHKKWVHNQKITYLKEVVKQT